MTDAPIGIGKIARRFTFKGEAIGAGLAFGAGSLWLTLGSDVARVDPESGRVLHRFPTGSRWLVFADRAIWAVLESSMNMAWT